MTTNALKSSDFIKSRVEQLANDFEKQNMQQKKQWQQSQKPQKQNISAITEGHRSNSLSLSQIMNQSLLKEMILSGIKHQAPVSNTNYSTRHTHKTCNNSNNTSLLIKNNQIVGKDQFKIGSRMNLALNEKSMRKLDSESQMRLRSLNSAKKFEVRDSTVIEEEGYPNSARKIKIQLLIEEVRQIESDIKVLTTKLTKQILETTDNTINKYRLE